MSLLVRAYPLVGSIADLEQFVHEAETSRREDMDRMYRAYGVAHESWHLQDTPSGPWVISVALIDEPAAAGARFAASEDSFDCWFKGCVRTLSGVDPATQPLGPATTQVFSWSDKARPSGDLSVA